MNSLPRHKSSGWSLSGCFLGWIFPRRSEWNQWLMNKAYVFEKLLDSKSRSTIPHSRVLFLCANCMLNDFLVPVENVLFNGFIKRLDWALTTNISKHIVFSLDKSMFKIFLFSPRVHWSHWVRFSLKMPIIAEWPVPVPHSVQTTGTALSSL